MSNLVGQPVVVGHESLIELWQLVFPFLFDWEDPIELVCCSSKLT